MLTTKQETFARKIVEGMSQADAYRSAYDTKSMTDKTVHEKASLLASQDKVRARITELRDKLATESVMSAQKRLEWLTEVIKDKNEKTENKLKAADIMNKMQGEYVTKVEGNLSVTKLEDLI
jgi:phage terminase small subunit